MEQANGTLRATRERLKLPLREVAKRSRIFAEERADDSYQISANWLDRLERQEVNLSITTLVVLAHVYGISAEELFFSIYPDSRSNFPSPDETTLLSPKSIPVLGPYRLGIIGKRDLTMVPLVPPGTVVRIDTRLSAVPELREWSNALARPIYFLLAENQYFCGWCKRDLLGKSLILVPHPQSPAIRRSWIHQTEVEIVGRVVSMTVPSVPRFVQ